MQWTDVKRWIDAFYLKYQFDQFINLIKRQLVAFACRPFCSRWWRECIPNRADLCEHSKSKHFLRVTNSFKFVDVADCLIELVQDWIVSFSFIVPQKLS